MPASIDDHAWHRDDATGLCFLGPSHTPQVWIAHGENAFAAKADPTLQSFLQTRYAALDAEARTLGLPVPALVLVCDPACAALGLFFNGSERSIPLLGICPAAHYRDGTLDLVLAEETVWHELAHAFLAARSPQVERLAFTEDEERAAESYAHHRQSARLLRDLEYALSARILPDTETLL